MKIVKKIVYIIIFVIASLVMYSTIVKAATTITVATETLNLRKEASTSSDIVATLSEGLKCELIREDGDWYKVKYNKYIGYVSKEYVTKNEDNSQTDTKADGTSDDTNNDDNNNANVDTDSNQSSDTNVDMTTQSTGKISIKTDVRIVPLIYSSKIDELAKNASVTILNQMNGWSYIQTDTITGWIRSDVITGKKVVSNGSDKISEKTNTGTTNNSSDNNEKTTTGGEASGSTTDNNQTTSYTEKTMYVNESSVNVRTQASTSSKIMMVLGLNQKLTVIGESGDWYRVKTSEGNGYVSKELLSDKQTTTSRGVKLSDRTTTTSRISATTIVAKATAQTNGNTTSSKVSYSSSVKGEKVVKYAKQFLGVPYVYGGASKSGFDCSGFTMYVYKKFGISMEHGAKMQSKLGKAVNADKKSASSLKRNLQAGDLVFFLDYETMEEIGHCGIYIGDGKFIHASSGSGYCVKINSLLPGEYYNTRYCAARRVL